MARERGYTFCKRGKKLTRGVESTGDAHSVSVSVGCPPRSKPRAIFHTHPSGSLQPSARDLDAAKQHNLPVCIKAGRKVRCYRPKH